MVGSDLVENLRLKSSRVENLFVVVSVRDVMLGFATAFMEVLRCWLPDMRVALFVEALEAKVSLPVAGGSAGSRTGLEGYSPKAPEEAMLSATLADGLKVNLEAIAGVNRPRLVSAARGSPQELLDGVGSCLDLALLMKRHVAETEQPAAGWVDSG